MANFLPEKVLPECPFPIQYPGKTVFDINNIREYSFLCNIVRNFLCGDCYSLEIKFSDTDSEPEMLFNLYKEKSTLDTIMDQMIRYHLIEYPHASLLVYIIRKQIPAFFNIYIYQSTMACRVNFEFDPELLRFTISFFSVKQDEVLEADEMFKEIIDFEYDDDDSMENPLRQQVIKNMVAKMKKMIC